tara:strand:+ start:442 stop:1518 length:1077 start_codon:yes stop_codon:yes gene_type:complete
MSNKILLDKAKNYLKLCYSELNKEDLFPSRWKEVQEEVALKDTYDLLDFELDYGAKVAWRNSNKCIGRIFWQNMDVFDKRLLSDSDSIFEALFNHIIFSTNEGKIKSTITIFSHFKGIRIWNPQLLSFAGYQNKSGKIIGDPKQIDFTKECIKLGWKPKKGSFDILPLVIQIGNQKPEWREIPKNIVRLVPIEHPNYDKIKDLNLVWYSTPIISNMMLEIGGLEFKAAPFNGWYMGTEIGARNLADVNRYNLLPTIAKIMGLDMKDKTYVWKDRALVELNYAVLYSFKKYGVKIVDHHSASKQFMKFMSIEAKKGREVTADWSWIVPPISGSATEVFHTEMNNTIKYPNYFYQKDVWE